MYISTGQELGTRTLTAVRECVCTQQGKRARCACMRESARVESYRTTTTRCAVHCRQLCHVDCFVEPHEFTFRFVFSSAYVYTTTHMHV